MSLAGLLNPSARHLPLFTGCLLVLLYGYEIFNFSLSIDEETFGDKGAWVWFVMGLGRWGTAMLTRLFPPLGDIPMISTLLFCAGLGASACILARLLFHKQPAQFAFAGIFVSYPLWPHIAHFNIIAWCVGIGCLFVTLALLFCLANHRIADILAICLLAFAAGIYEAFFAWFLVLVCVSYLSVTLGTSNATDTVRKFSWLRIWAIAFAALLAYFAVQRFTFLFVARKQYVQGWMRLHEYTTSPLVAASSTLDQCWKMLTGSHPIFLGYGKILMLLPLVGVLMVLGHLLWSRTWTRARRVLTAAVFIAAFMFALSPSLVAAGVLPARALIALTPLVAFLSGLAFSKTFRLAKLFYVALGMALFISVWINVSLFYTDHLVRQRDQALAIRIMSKVDQILPNPPAGRVPFVVVGGSPWPDEGNFRKVEVFGDSYFDTSHEGGNPYRVAAYLRTLGVNTLEARLLSDAVQHRAVIATMPVWPAAGSVAMVGDILVIKLGALPPT